MDTKPKRLYKFMPDRYVLSSEWPSGEKIRGSLEERHLKISFANQVNDVFELRPFDFGKGRNAQNLRKAWDAAIDKHAMKQGFISFTSGWSIPTMWAHYADSHKGCCLGFDVSFERSGQPFVAEMRYSDTLLPIDDRVRRDEQYNEERIFEARTTKGKHWEYEKEFRVWSSLNKEEIERKKNDLAASFFVPFSENLRLREVIIGFKSNFEKSDLRKHLLPDDDVTLRKARPSYRAFEMVEQSGD